MHPKAGAGCGEETLGKLRGGEGHRGGWTMVGGAGKCGVMADVKVLIQDVSGWLLLSYLARAFCSFACPPHPILLYFAHLMPYILSPSPSPSSSSLRSPITFSNERGLGAFTPLATLPRRKSQKKSLFHIPADDDHEPSPPPSPPLTTPDDIVQEGLPARISIPFPSSSPLPSLSSSSLPPLPFPLFHPPLPVISLFFRFVPCSSLVSTLPQTLPLFPNSHSLFFLPLSPLPLFPNFIISFLIYRNLIWKAGSI